VFDNDFTVLKQLVTIFRELMLEIFSTLPVPEKLEQERSRDQSYSQSY